MATLIPVKPRSESGLDALALTSAPSIGDQHVSLVGAITDVLRKKILDGEYSQGDRLVEGRLSEQLGVSRIPVREALRALSAEGLVTIEPRRGASVVVISERLARDLVTVRADLESLKARLAAQRRSGDDVRRLAHLLESGNAAHATGDVAAMVEVNNQVHELIAAVTANEVLGELVRSLRDRTALLFAPINRARASQNWADHAVILQAVIDGDAELAALLASRHVEHAVAAYLDRQKHALRA